MPLLIKNNNPMATIIVSIPASHNFSRKLCETIENETFENVQDLKDLIGLNDEVSIYALTDFMDAINDDDFDMNSRFISYVTITNY